MLNETELQEIEKALRDLHGLDPEWNKLCGQAADAIRELQRQVQEREADARRYRWLDNNIASALRQVAQEKERETLERVATALHEHMLGIAIQDYGYVSAFRDAENVVRSLSPTPTPTELLTTQELADGARHLSESEQKVMDRALVASVKIVDDGYVRVPREPTERMLRAAFDVFEIAPGTQGFTSGADARIAIYRAMIQAAEKGE